MSGHSHWAGIKHRKGLNDAKRAKIFTKIGKLLTIAARTGGGNPDTNISLRLVVAQARAANMPKDTIERAIARAAGEAKDGAEIQEAIYEAYFGAGDERIAMIIKTATDNKNRTAGELKTIFNKSPAQLVGQGAASYLFRAAGIVTISLSTVSNREELELAAIDAGADDIVQKEGELFILTNPTRLKAVEETLSESGTALERSSLGFWPLQTMTIPAATRAEYEKFLEILAEQDDVEEIYDNLKEAL